MRSLLAIERPVVEYLFELAGISADLEALEVQSMADGGMGSLSIGAADAGRKRKSTPSECHFFDQDGVVVSATLNVDDQGAPYEIDIWKVDFAPLISWPVRSALRAGPPN